MLNCTAGYVLAIDLFVGSKISVSNLKVDGSTFQAPVTDDLKVAISASAAKLNTSFEYAFTFSVSTISFS